VVAVSPLFTKELLCCTAPAGQMHRFFLTISQQIYEEFFSSGHNNGMR
jgi:hypothetical protein